LQWELIITLSLWKLGGKQNSRFSFANWTTWSVMKNNCGLNLLSLYLLHLVTLFAGEGVISVGECVLLSMKIYQILSKSWWHQCCLFHSSVYYDPFLAAHAATADPNYRLQVSICLLYFFYVGIIDCSLAYDAMW
jgi:hypothetical protein